MTERDKTGALALDAVRRRLDAARGRDYWRSLEELAGTPGFHEMLQREFPRHAAEWPGPLGRRRFLHLMGASLALAGLSGCTRQPAESILPYVSQPEHIVPGVPLFYATAMTLGGAATGLLVETHEGRPTKIEGNAEHPTSLGATDALAQAAILGLYDPDRSQTLSYLGEIRPYSAFLAAMSSALKAQRALGGEGLRVLTGPVTSPTLGGQLRRLLRSLPKARWHQYDPVAADGARAGASVAFGEPVNTLYRLAEADVVVSLDADFLNARGASLRYAREFADRRRPAGNRPMNRLYVVECSPTITGSKADHRARARPAEVAALARALAAKLGVPGVAGGPVAPDRAAWLAALARDLEGHRGASVVVPGDFQPPAVHALAHAINAHLGNAGRTVVYTDPLEAEPVDPFGSLRELRRDLEDGRVDLLLILGGNPVYDAPVDFDFAASMQRAGLRVHLGLYNDETSELCQWHVPEAHFLESWGDTRAHDGTVALQQPMIAPLYRGKSAYEVLAALTDRPERSAYDLVRAHWQAQGAGGADFEAFWRRSLHDGVVAGTALPARSMRVRFDRVAAAAASIPAGPPEAGALDVVFRPDPNVYDGRFANNGWLQELPKPLTKLTWDNAALVGVDTARHLGLGIRFGSRGGEHGEAFTDLVELGFQGRTVRAPVWVVPGHPEGVVTLHLGYGRTRAGRVGTGLGFNAYALRPSDAPWSGSGLSLRKTGERYALANTQGHWNLEGRDLVRSGSLQRFREHPDLAPPHAHGEPGPEMTMYRGAHEYDGYAWGMTIDLNACTGCNSCIVACQAENNIPVVGKDQVGAGREMHWLRVDRYHKGSPDDPDALETYFQPVPCMQCENAPCEVVCPVAATVHSSEGLNDMVYNRCIGTRYCSNNCPYKVRRFNFFLYQDWDTPTYKLMRNPEVTVRSRGVMEKCTYCVQRINRAKIAAEIDDRPVRDGEITTACEAACPARAITFGDVNDPDSRVSRNKAEPRNYSLLASVNTRPRTTYLGAVRNTNPELAAHDIEHDDAHGS